MTLEELDNLAKKYLKQGDGKIRTHEIGDNWIFFCEALGSHWHKLQNALLAGKAYLDAFDGDNGPSIVEHDAREAFRAKLKELGL